MSRIRGTLGHAMKSVRMAIKNPLIEALCALAVMRLDRRTRTPADLDADPPKRILVIRTDRIGDLLCGTPLIAALHAKWPDAHITLVGGPKNRAVMPLLPYVERAPVEFEKHPASWLRLRHWLGSHPFDLAVSLRSEVFSGALLAAWSRARVRAVVNAVRTLPAFNLVLAPHVQHQVRRYCVAAAALGVEWLEHRPMFEIPTAAAAKADEWVDALGGPAEAPLIGVGIPNRADGNHRVKAWSAEKLERFVALLVKSGARVVLFGVGSERIEAGAISSRVAGATVAPTMPLAQVAAVQRRLDVFVASYTGTLHLADGAGTRTVAIGSVANREYWRPLGERHRQLAAEFVPSIEIEAALEAVRELVPGRLAGAAGVPGVGAAG